MLELTVGRRSTLDDAYGAAVIRKRVVVEGRVQGVGFRASCARRAREVGVHGMVRNRHDGCVEAVFEGADEAVAAMVAWCRGGPTTARVRRVRVVDEQPLGETTFRVTG